MKKLLLLPCVALAILSSCGGGKKDTAEQQTAPEVKVETVHRQAVEQLQEYTATVNPYTKNTIASFQATMRIEKILVETGDRVSAGQLLVQMEEANYLQAKLQLENLKTEYGRVQALHESGGVSQQQVDQLRTQLEVSEKVLGNLEKNTYLRSPVGGMVTQRNFDNGDISGGQPILQVQQLHSLKVNINIQEAYFPLVKAKMPATVYIESYAGETFEGKVTLVHPTIDPTTHTFVAEITLNNSQMRIRPGMFARVRFNFGSASRVVAPDRAIVKQTGTNDRYVYVLNSDRTVSYKKVELGQRMEGYYEVLSGVNDGEQVITAGLSRLIDGTTVTVISE